MSLLRPESDPLDFMQDGRFEDDFLDYPTFLLTDSFEVDTRQFVVPRGGQCKDVDWGDFQNKYKEPYDDSLDAKEKMLRYPVPSDEGDKSMPWLTGYFPEEDCQVESFVNDLNEQVGKREEKLDKQSSDLASILDDIDALLGESEPAKPPTIPLKRKARGVVSVDLQHGAMFVPSAKTYSFELDAFQKSACRLLEEEQEGDLFIAASTSAGKTVIAEYAIALSLKHLRRTIYTSPIKALSNQKYGEFKSVFNQQDHDSLCPNTVGIVTGDVQVNGDAPCVVMTTEILRSMLYLSQEDLSDVEFVIFDEIHYMNDAERGVVYEELIIGLPPWIRLIFLSATLPNLKEFAGWIHSVRQRPVFVIEMLRRPIPLTCAYWHDTQRHEIQGIDGKINTETYFALKKVIAQERHGKPMSSIVANVVRFQQRHNGLPMVLFIFSRKQAETLYDSLTLDLLDESERAAVMDAWAQWNNVLKLKPSDRQLPQFRWILGGLRRGIGIHHSGILPCLKEIVELCMSRSWIKVLIATETFAMGLNMPAKSVLFTHTRKIVHAHEEERVFRDLSTSEFLQMAGRAGRRGLDTHGQIILLPESNNTLHSIETLRRWLTGPPVALSSQFRLTWRTLLQFIKMHRDIERDLLSKSYLNASQYHLAECKTRLSLLQMYDYVKEDTLLLKGKLALQVMTMDEFMIVEAVAHGFFKDLSVHEFVALLSIFIYKPPSPSPFIYKLDAPVDIDWPTSLVHDRVVSVVDLASTLAIHFDQLLDSITTAYYTQWDVSLVPFLYAWSMGQSFNKLLHQSNPGELSEGLLVRQVLRIGEACRDMQQLARILGNHDLLAVAERAETAIKRDICFTPSLYL